MLEAKKVENHCVRVRLGSVLLTQLIKLNFSKLLESFDQNVLVVFLAKIREGSRLASHALLTNIQ